MSNDGNKKTKKKKTSTQKSTTAPVYNEEIVFTNIKKDKLAEIQIQLSIHHDTLTHRETLGCVTIGSMSRGNEYIQWKDMCDSKKSIAWWQTLHQCAPENMQNNETNEYSLNCLPSSGNNHNNNNSNNNSHMIGSSGNFKNRSSINAKLRKFLARSTSINR